MPLRERAVGCPRTVRLNGTGHIRHKYTLSDPYCGSQHYLETD